MKHLLVTDKEGKKICDNLEEECKNCFKECASTGNQINSCPKYGTIFAADWFKRAKYEGREEKNY